MSLRIVQEDLLEGLTDPVTCVPTIVLHGCNCFHTMGAGVALYLRIKYPQVYDVDKTFTEKGDKAKLGTYTAALISGRLYILNCYTQYRYGRDKQYAEYWAIERCFKLISNYIDHAWKIRMSKIGCGNAGGDWAIVQQSVEQHLKYFDVTVCYK